MIKLHIHKAEQNGHNGHITIHARIIETDEKGGTKEGALETHGIDPDALGKLFQGDTERWKDYVAGIMIDRHRRRSQIHAEIVAWAGQDYDLSAKIERQHKRKRKLKK